MDRLDYNPLGQPTGLWLGDGGLLRWEFGYYDQDTPTPNLTLRTASVKKNGLGPALLSFNYGYRCNSLSRGDM